MAEGGGGASALPLRLDTTGTQRCGGAYGTGPAHWRCMGGTSRLGEGCRGYSPRLLDTPLHQAVREGLSGFLDDADGLGGLPAFVTKEFHKYLRCGDLQEGFVRVYCPSCKKGFQVGFSCKGRTVCPSCTARRAAVTAANLVDNVLPCVPFRQWTLAFPRGLKFALVMDSSLLSAALRTLVRAIFAWQRRRAKQLGIAGARPGAIAFVQYFTSALLLHPHAHVLVPDGVFDGAGAFRGLSPPGDEDVEGLLRKVAIRVLKLAQARFPDGLPYAEDAKAALSAASAQTRLPLDEGGWPPKPRRRCAFLEGFSLHADTWVHENDRESLERLAHYGARGPIALNRLTLREDGKVEYRLKKPLPGGSTTLLMTKVQLLKRLCALVVRPRIHLTRFFGVFAPNSSARAQVVPSPPPPKAPAAVPLPVPVHTVLSPPNLIEVPSPETLAPPRPRIDWAQLLRRTWGFDVFACPCGGRRRVIALIDSPELARHILRSSQARTRPATGPPLRPLPN